LRTDIEKNQEEQSNRRDVGWKILVLFIVGFTLVFVGSTILVAATIFFGESTVSFGGIIFIGPFPIVIGVGPDAPLMVLFAIALAVLSTITFLIIRSQQRKE
jgi:uncharacterized membrane protein